MTPARASHGGAVGPVQTGGLFDEPQRGAHRALGVVFMDDGNAENADDGVAYVLLHGAAESLDHLARQGAEGAQAGVDVLRVRLLAHRGEADDVAEQRGDGLALLRQGREAAASRLPQCGQKRDPSGVPASHDGHTLTPRPSIAFLPSARGRAAQS